MNLIKVLYILVEYVSLHTFDLIHQLPCASQYITASNKNYLNPFVFVNTNNLHEPQLATALNG